MHIEVAKLPTETSNDVIIRLLDNTALHNKYDQTVGQFFFKYVCLRNSMKNTSPPMLPVSLRYPAR